MPDCRTTAGSSGLTDNSGADSDRRGPTSIDQAEDNGASASSSHADSSSAKDLSGNDDEAKGDDDEEEDEAAESDSSDEAKQDSPIEIAPSASKRSRTEQAAAQASMTGSDDAVIGRVVSGGVRPLRSAKLTTAHLTGDKPLDWSPWQPVGSGQALGCSTLPPSTEGTVHQQRAGQQQSQQQPQPQQPPQRPQLQQQQKRGSSQATQQNGDQQADHVQQKGTEAQPRQPQPPPAVAARRLHALPGQQALPGCVQQTQLPTLLPPLYGQCAQAGPHSVEPLQQWTWPAGIAAQQPLHPVQLQQQQPLQPIQMQQQQPNLLQPQQGSGLWPLLSLGQQSLTGQCSQQVQLAVLLQEQALLQKQQWLQAELLTLSQQQRELMAVAQHLHVAYGGKQHNVIAGQQAPQQENVAPVQHP